MTNETALRAMLARDQGEALWFFGSLTVIKADGDRYALAEQLFPLGIETPLHVQPEDDETFYVLEGEVSIRLGDETITAGAGDFVNVPRGLVHCFKNEGSATARMILTFTPAGMERFFEETLERALDPTLDPPDNVETVGARYAAAAPRYGIEFLTG